MLSNPFSRRLVTDDCLQNWLSERQKLILSLNKLCNLRPFSQWTTAHELTSHLATFCECLVDYISLGHFKMFEYILNKVEQCHKTLPEQYQHLMQKLLQTTICATEFNDKYQTGLAIHSLDSNLSHLALQLAQRFEWEDQLISLLEMLPEPHLHQAKPRAG